ncbi:MAG: PQQ-dependent sugar dehydrogenase [Parvibaculum sp.]
MQSPTLSKSRSGAPLKKTGLVRFACLVMFALVWASLVWAPLVWAPVVWAADDPRKPSMGADEAVGTQYHIRLEMLPEPTLGKMVSNRAIVVPRPSGAWLRVPTGFEASLVAEGLDGPRALAVAADGSIFVTEPTAGRITRLQDSDKDGVAETRGEYARGFHLPSGISISGGKLYIADERAVWLLGSAVGKTVAPTRQPVTRAGAFGDTGGHWTRMLTFSPDGQSFYVSVGSVGNLDEEAAPRATVQRFDMVQGEQTLFASGLRNPIGLAFQPGSPRLFTVVSERDGYGDALVPDYMTELRPGGFYGWPYAYLGAHPDPSYGDIRPDLVARTLEPDVLFAAHSSAVDLAFNAGGNFPSDYTGDAFVSFHGSWNATTPTGYKIVRVPFEEGRPVGTYETFVAGFWTEGDTPARVWGRPTGLVFDNDGSLLIAEDASGTIWRVRYVGDKGGDQ